jgi:hypothetical protein
VVTLAAVPMRWLSWDFALQQPTGEVAGQVCLSSWRERGSIQVPGFSCKVRRDGLLGPFLAEASDGSRVASAIKPSALRREFAITHTERRYVLKAVSSWRRECALFDEGYTRLGQVRPESWLSRRARVELDDRVPPLLQAFVVWLTLLLWKRDGDAVAVGTAGS